MNYITHEISQRGRFHYVYNGPQEHLVEYHLLEGVWTNSRWLDWLLALAVGPYFDNPIYIKMGEDWS